MDDVLRAVALVGRVPLQRRDVGRHGRRQLRLRGGPVGEPADEVDAGEPKE